jgi:serine/threonine protein kinase
MSEPETRRLPDTERLRQRLADDLAAGKTISLSSDDLADPSVRSRLPDLLESLRGTQPKPPTRLVVPGYTLLGEIGHGGMSTVHLARQDALGRHVALKIAPKWLGSDAATQQRLLQEARAMARVSHPNIVAIHDIVEVDDTVAIAMEWIDGLTLAGLLRCLDGPPRDGDMAVVTTALGTRPEFAAKLEPSAERFFVRMLHDVARALHRVHQAGLLHLDIKPSNVLIRRDGTPLLADFGVVREIDLAATHTRTFAGTPLYAAPEQIRRLDQQLGAHTDVYALGMTLYEALSRTQPLQKLDLARILTTVEGGRVPRLDTVTDVAEDLVNIVHKAIAPERQHRYATAEAFADDLAAFLDHRPVSARPLTRLQRLQRWVHVEPWKASLTISLLVLLPLLLGTGGYLAAQLPRIARSRLEEQQRQAAHLRQAGYLDQVFELRPIEHSLQQLRLAQQLDPRPFGLACLLSLALERAPQKANALLDEFAADVAREPALAPLVAKVRAGKPFFDAATTAELRARPDALSRFLLAIDRFWYANDRATEIATEEATTALEEAGVAYRQDPLMQGLQALALGWARRGSGVAAIERAMASSFGETDAALAWTAAAWFEIDPEDGTRRLKRLEAAGSLPAHQCALALELLLACGPDYTMRQRQRSSARLRDLRQIGERLLAAAPDNEEVVWRHALTLLRSDDEAGLHALLHQRGHVLTTGRQALLAALGCIARSEATAADTLADAAGSMDDLKLMFRELLHREGQLVREIQDATAGEQARPARTQLLELIDVAWATWTKAHPDRHCFHNERLATLYVNDRFDDAVQLVAACEFPRWTRARNPQALAAMKVTTRDWQGLVDNAKLWLRIAETGFQRQEAAAYYGIGLARLGKHQQAAEQFALALTRRPPPGRGKWFAYTLLEDAWLHVAPDTPEELRDPILAAHRLAVFREHNATMRPKVHGQWTQLIRAEVLFANGDAKGAIELLRSQEPGDLDAELQQPDEIQRLRSDATLRYRGR